MSFGVVTVRKGQRTARWSADHVNPGCPIDAKSAEIHHITDVLVAAAPSFAGVVAPLLTLLRPDPAERTVFVAHNVSFDAPVVREEIARVGESMPELPVLDTMPLMSVAGIVTADGKRRLPDLCDALGIALTDHHTALVDAEATAEALIALLNRAADEGQDDLDALLALLGGHTTHSLRFVSRFRDAERPAEPEIPPAHLATHATILPAKPGKQALAAWLKAADECAGHRCGGLDDRIAAAEMPPAAVFGHLLPRLRARAGGSARRHRNSAGRDAAAAQAPAARDHGPGQVRAANGSRRSRRRPRATARSAREVRVSGLLPGVPTRGAVCAGRCSTTGTGARTRRGARSPRGSPSWAAGPSGSVCATRTSATSTGTSWPSAAITPTHPYAVRRASTRSRRKGVGREAEESTTRRS